MPLHADDRSDVVDEPIEPPISATRLLRTLAAYRRILALALLAIVIGYSVLALVLFLRAPTVRTTTLLFKLNFEGASSGRYPNGLTFSPADIVGTWILNDVFQANQLGQFTTGVKFGRAIGILESNPQYDAAAADYQARLADPRVSPIDRERILREWETKRNSLSRNEYALTFVRTEGVQRIPEPAVRKAMVDILGTWARVAASERHVLEYPVSVLSPSFVSPAASDPDEPIVSAQLLRGKIRHVMENVAGVQEIPGSELLRSTEQRASLQEIQLRLEDLVRFRLDPLVQTIRTSGLIVNPAGTASFLETQLQYDRHVLKRHETSIASVREALSMYALQNRSPSTAVRGPGPSTPDPNRAAPTETLMPQLGDTFIDRLAELTRASAGLEYRQKLIDEYRRLTRELIPAQEAVAYDEDLVARVRTAERGGGADRRTVTADLERIRADVSALLVELNDIYGSLSRNRTPVAELFTTTAPFTTQSIRGRDAGVLVLYGVLVLLISLPILLMTALIHHRQRREIRQERVDQAGR